MAKKKARIPIPKDLAALVLFKADRTCCVCRIADRLVEIHHIDDDPSNNVESNLAVLCKICHGKTLLKGAFARHLDAEQVILYKKDWEHLVSSARKPSASESQVTVSQFIESHTLLDGTRKVDASRRLPEPLLGPKPKDLVDDLVPASSIMDNRLSYVSVQDVLWHPATMEPLPRLVIGHPSFSKEFPLRHPFRSFKAIVSPNGSSFELVMKLMNASGALPVHMVHGEASFILRNNRTGDGMMIGYVEGGEEHERPIDVVFRPRFTVELLVLPMNNTSQMAARLSLNGKVILTKVVLKEHTLRFGLVASGNGKPCHMSLSEIWVRTAAK